MFKKSVSQSQVVELDIIKVGKELGLDIDRLIAAVIQGKDSKNQ